MLPDTPPCTPLELTDAICSGIDGLQVAAPAWGICIPIALCTSALGVAEGVNVTVGDAVNEGLSVRVGLASVSRISVAVSVETADGVREGMSVGKMTSVAVADGNGSVVSVAVAVGKGSCVLVSVGIRVGSSVGVKVGGISVGVVVGISVGIVVAISGSGVRLSCAKTLVEISIKRTLSNNVRRGVSMTNPMNFYPFISIGFKPLAGSEKLNRYMKFI